MRVNTKVLRELIPIFAVHGVVNDGPDEKVRVVKNGRIRHPISLIVEEVTYGAVGRIDCPDLLYQDIAFFRNDDGDYPFEGFTSWDFKILCLVCEDKKKIEKYVEELETNYQKRMVRSLRKELLSLVDKARNKK